MTFEASRKMNKQVMSVQSGADESPNLPDGFCEEMTKKCNAFLDKRGLRNRTFLHGFCYSKKSKGGAK